MQPIFHFDSNSDAYTAGAAVVACFDARFDLALRKLLKRLRVERPDLIRVAGGAKALAQGCHAERAFLLEQLRASRRLHGARTVLLVAHSDCGAYGGLSATFGGDVGRERGFHGVELRRAARVLGQELPELSPQLYFVDFSGAFSIAAAEPP